MSMTFNGNIQLIGKQPLSVTENGTYNAPSGKAYDPVTVNVAGGSAEEQLKGLISNAAQHIDIPQGTTRIRSDAFRDLTSLYTINIPSSVTFIGTRAFYGCHNLGGPIDRNINIPNSVTHIGSSVFDSCYLLDTITCDFSEGAVSGAPWGAPRKTQIIYLR